MNEKIVKIISSCVFIKIRRCSCRYVSHASPIVMYSHILRINLYIVPHQTQILRLQIIWLAFTSSFIFRELKTIAKCRTQYLFCSHTCSPLKVLLQFSSTGSITSLVRICCQKLPFKAIFKHINMKEQFRNVTSKKHKKNAKVSFTDFFQNEELKQLTYIFEIFSFCFSYCLFF